VRGKGTYTMQRRMELQLYLMSFTADMRRRGLNPSSEVLGTAECVPPPTTASALRLAPGATAWRTVPTTQSGRHALAVERAGTNRGHLPSLLDLDLTDSLYTHWPNGTGWSSTTRPRPSGPRAADRETARLLASAPEPHCWRSGGSRPQTARPLRT